MRTKEEGTSSREFCWFFTSQGKAGVFSPEVWRWHQQGPCCSREHGDIGGDGSSTSEDQSPTNRCLSSDMAARNLPSQHGHVVKLQTFKFGKGFRWIKAEWSYVKLKGGGIGRSLVNPILWEASITRNCRNFEYAHNTKCAPDSWTLFSVFILNFDILSVFLHINKIKKKWKY